MISNDTERNFIGELRTLKELKIKPNFSYLSRKYGVDRHTLAKCFEAGKVPERKKREYHSKWDPLEDEIIELMSIEGTSKKAAFMFLSNKLKEDIPGTYNSFKAYTLKKGITVNKPVQAHVFYETNPGEQLQFDWKESLSITLMNGEIINFNVFSATLGYSREHIFIFSYYKTLEDVIRCLIECFRRIGGTTNELLTDNMASIVSVRGKTKKVNPKFSQFCKDLNITLRLAKTRTPETKGKVEVSNRFMDWLVPYDGKLETAEELIDVIENVITSQANNEVNQRTRIAPAVLFRKEKEKLNPLPSGLLLEAYIENRTRRKVPSTLLVKCDGAGYSVPQKYIDKYVDVLRIGESIYIYHADDLIATHVVSGGKINYKAEHYKEALSSRIHDSTSVDIDEMARMNLKKLERLG